VIFTAEKVIWQKTTIAYQQVYASDTCRLKAKNGISFGARERLYQEWHLFTYLK